MSFLNRIRHFWRLRQMERDLTEEMDHHRTMSGDQAMGDMDEAFADSRQVWRGPWWRRFCSLRYIPRWFARRYWNRPDQAASFLEELTSVSFVAAVFGWRWLTGTPFTGRSAVSLAGIYLVGSLIQGFVQGFVGAALQGKGKPKRVFVEDPHAVLELAKLTGYESIQPFNRYRGKWMTVTGEFEGWTQSLDGEAIHASTILGDGRRLVLRFDRDQRDSLQPLQAGQRITVIGQVEHIGFELRPQHCELVLVQPVRPTPRLTLAC